MLKTLQALVKKDCYSYIISINRQVYACKFQVLVEKNLLYIANKLINS